jgi:hypothetical protein
VYGSPAICCWREPVVSRILGRNWQSVVLGVLDIDRAHLTYRYNWMKNLLLVAYVCTKY